MANKKIQIKNNAGDNLYPVVKKETIETFDINGRAKPVTVTGVPTGSVVLTGGALPSLTVTTTSTGGVQFVSSLTTTAVSPTTAAINQVTNAGTPTTVNSLSVVTSMSFLPGIVLGAGESYSGRRITGGVDLAVISKGDYSILNLSIASLCITRVDIADSIVEGTAPTLSQVRVVTGVTGGTVRPTVSYVEFTPGSLISGATFTGSNTTFTGTYTPEGTVGGYTGN